MFIEKSLFFVYGSCVSKKISFGIHRGFYLFMSFTIGTSLRIYCSSLSWSIYESLEFSILLLSRIPSIILEFAEPALEIGLISPLKSWLNIDFSIGLLYKDYSSKISSCNIESKSSVPLMSEHGDISPLIFKISLNFSFTYSILSW